MLSILIMHSYVPGLLLQGWLGRRVCIHTSSATAGARVPVMAAELVDPAAAQCQVSGPLCLFAAQCAALRLQQQPLHSAVE